MRKFKNEKKKVCRIEEVNINTGRVILYYKGGLSTIVHSDLKNVTQDPDIISSINSVHASWLGYYYGKFRTTSETSWSPNKSPGLFLKSNKGIFNILSQDRAGNILYVNKLNNERYLCDPISLLQNEYEIDNFDPSQACYIGILAWYGLSKRQSNFPTKPELRLVR